MGLRPVNIPEYPTISAIPNGSTSTGLSTTVGIDSTYFIEFLAAVPNIHKYSTISATTTNGGTSCMGQLLRAECITAEDPRDTIATTWLHYAESWQ
jgi:hypothetical protein